MNIVPNARNARVPYVKTVEAVVLFKCVEKNIPIEPIVTAVTI
jgi:hypothetical protein